MGVPYFRKPPDYVTPKSLQPPQIFLERERLGHRGQALQSQCVLHHGHFCIRLICTSSCLAPGETARRPLAVRASSTDVWDGARKVLPNEDAAVPDDGQTDVCFTGSLAGAGLDCENLPADKRPQALPRILIQEQTALLVQIWKFQWQSGRVCAGSLQCVLNARASTVGDSHAPALARGRASFLLLRSSHVGDALELLATAACTGGSVSELAVQLVCSLTRTAEKRQGNVQL